MGPKDPVTGRHGWTHCDDKSPLCHGASAVYPSNTSEIVGKYCGMDDC